MAFPTRSLLPSAVLGALLVLTALPASAGDAPAPSTNALCAHLAANAVDYPPEAAKDCTQETEALKGRMGPAFAAAAHCMLALPNPTRDATRSCMEAAEGGQAPGSDVDMAALEAEMAAIQGEMVTDVCNHMKAHAVDFPKEAAASCEKDLGRFATELGANFPDFAMCMLDVEKPTREDSDRCGDAAKAAP